MSELSPPPPEQFGRYVLLRKLAEGGMAEIWLAKQVGPDGFARTLVLKRVLPHLAGQDEFLTMFLDEARIAAGLQHPNVVQISDYGVENGRHFLAMEYLPGEDVHSICRKSAEQRQPIPPVVAAKILSGVCEGLHYAHEFRDQSGKPLGLVHRDISPSNIFVTYHGYVKVLDFGIAKAENKLTHTKTGMVKGKFAYMSPEQASGERIDSRSDVWALGVVLYEMLAGQRLFRRESELAVLKAILQDPLKPVADVRSDVPGELSVVVMKALARRVDDRFQSAEEMRVALERFLSLHPYVPAAAHLKSYMLKLFGESRMAERLNDPTATAFRPPSGSNSFGGTRRAAQDPDAIPTAHATPFKEVSSESPADAGGPGTSAPRSPSDPELLPIGPRPAPPRRRHVLAISGGIAVVMVVGAVGWASRRVEPPPEPIAALEIAPEPATGTVVVNSDPGGASVFVAGRLHGTTPVAIEALRVGDRIELRLELAGHRPLTTGAVVAGGGVTLVQERLHRVPALLSVTAAPPGAQLWVDGTSRGAAPGPLELEAGTREVRVTATGYEPFSISVNLAPGEERSIPAPLKRSARGAQPARTMGELLVSCLPWCRIYVDGQDTGKVSPYTFQLPSGRHRLKVINPPSGVEREVVVSVVANQLTRQVIELK